MLKTATAALLAASILAGPAFAREDVPADLTTMPPVSDAFKPKRTAWGDPDFRGTWPINDIAELPVERPDRFGNRFWMTPEEVAQGSARAAELQRAYKAEEEKGTIGRGHWIEYLAESRRTSMLVEPASGKLPELTEEGRRQASYMRSSWVIGQTYDWVDDFDSWDRCVTRGFPASMLPFRYNNGIRIFQSPGHVVVHLEMLGTRVIPLVGKDRADAAKWPDGVMSWLGNSRGWFEDANTLVIETGNIQPGASPLNMATRGVPPNNVMPMSPQARVTERLSLIDKDTITYEMRYADPVMFEAPFALRVDWKRDDSYEFFEYACHEGNVQVRNYITSNRALRAQQSADAKARLAATPVAMPAPPPGPAPAAPAAPAARR